MSQTVSLPEGTSCLIYRWHEAWLVVSNMTFLFHFIYGMSSFPLTNSFIFFKMVKLHHQPVMIPPILVGFWLFWATSSAVFSNSNLRDVAVECPLNWGESCINSCILKWHNFNGNNELLNPENLGYPIFRQTLLLYGGCTVDKYG